MSSWNDHKCRISNIKALRCKHNSHDDEELTNFCRDQLDIKEALIGSVAEDKHNTRHGLLNEEAVFLSKKKTRVKAMEHVRVSPCHIQQSAPMEMPRSALSLCPFSPGHVGSRMRANPTPDPPSSSCFRSCAARSGLLKSGSQER